MNVYDIFWAIVLAWIGIGIIKRIRDIILDKIERYTRKRRWKAIK